ncbi:hypothetical protein AB4Z48_15470 [Cupriavidus sp. 2TAF22]|uniref:hypothetical protein n=1 Tax=unclassified Cupriavidus TaxID=2640874 RepID=UPI003F90975F
MFIGRSSYVIAACAIMQGTTRRRDGSFTARGRGAAATWSRALGFPASPCHVIILFGEFMG